MSLAVVEVDALLSELLDRVDHLEAAGEPEPWMNRDRPRPSESPGPVLRRLIRTCPSRGSSGRGDAPLRW